MVFSPARRTTIYGVAIGGGLLLSISCSSSTETETITRPSALRCGIEAQAEKLSFTPDGGTGTVRISTNRECSWSARSEAAWVTLASPVSGQGDGAVQFTVAAHADPTARATAIAVEDRRLQVSQDGRPCSVHLSSTLEAVEASGGDRMVRVEASSSQCRWTAVADVPWITIVSGREGNGSGTVGFRVDGVSGAPRSGTITIAGQVVQVEQGRGCIYSVAADTFTLGAAGGSGDIQVSAPAGCSWTAESRVAWITLAGGSTGTGPGVVGFRVAATDGPARTGTLTVAGRVVTITQSPICTVVVEPLTYSVPAAGGTGALSVRADAGCAWTATTASDWIVFNVGQGGKGNGELRFTVAANSGPARSGVVSLAGQTVTVTQASACTFTLTPSSVSVGAAASAATIQVTGPQSCPWSATTTASWITLGDRASGSGNGKVQVSFTANPGPARSGVVSLAGQTVTVMQAAGCTFTISPSSVSVGAAASAGAFQVTTAQGCPWSATTATSWIVLGEPASGTGNGQVPVSFAANSGPARQGSLTIGGRDIPVAQASGCTYSVSPPGQDVAGAGGTGAALVATAAGCPWTASSNAPWITATITTGVGPGQVPFTVAANPSPARTGTLTVAGQVFTVNQASLCTWTFSPPFHAFDAAGGNGNVLVIVSGSCSWTAASNVPWIVLTAGSSGTGGGLVQFVAAPNSGPARTGSLTIAGTRYEVVQAGR
jgi:Putative binding domain, N-terminal/Viral BACON domain